MLHEEAHASQKHSLDILFVELLQIIFWFNPLFYFIKRSIKLNHEFLADRAVLKLVWKLQTIKKYYWHSHQMHVTPSLAHSHQLFINQKTIYRYENTHLKKSHLASKFLILPLLSVLIYGFSTKEIVKKEIQSEIVQQKATKAEIAEYNKLARKYNAVDIEKRIIKKKDLESWKPFTEK